MNHSSPGALSRLGFSTVVAAGAAAGALNFVFMPLLAPWFPIVGLGPLIALGALYGSPVALCVLALTRGRSVPKYVLAGLACALGAGPGTVGAYAWFDAERERALERAVDYCKALRPALESHRDIHGRFPQTLSDVESPSPRPLLSWTGDIAYVATDEHFEFAINTSRGLGFHGARFESRYGSWRR